MEAASLDTSLDAQIDSYIAEEVAPTSPSSSANPDRDSISRDKERLQRFHKEALSFLTKAYSNDDDVLVEDRFDNNSPAARSNDDFLNQRRVELDRIRLERFHAQAVSFLDRAYADEPGTIVEEEALSPRTSVGAAQDREMLQRFHEEAMSFLDAAAGGAPGLGDGAVPDNNKGSGGIGKRGDRTSVRIERDKARLQQHYQDAMAFLDRAEAEKGAVLVEEQELELAVVERFKLQKYAQDAMSFLDKAFRNDESIMVGDEEDISGLMARAAMNRDGESVNKLLTDIDSRAERAATGPEEQKEGSATGDALATLAKAEEDRQIAADRAALEKYDEEFGDFLSKAYQDDSTVIVEDADSSTSGTERGLFARRMAQSTTSADTGQSGSATQDDEFSEEAYTDDEFQDPPVAESSQLEALRRSLPDAASRYADGNPESSLDATTDDGDETLRSRMMRYEREAADYLDGANVIVDGEDEEEEEEEEAEYPRPSPGLGVADVVQSRRDEQERHASEGDDHGHVLIEGDEEDDEDFDVDQRIDDETVPRAFYDDEHVSDDRESSQSDFEVQSSKYPDREDMPRASSERDPVHLRSPGARNLLVDVILEDMNGSKELSQVPLERSFYRQIPRGSTIKLRPLMSPQSGSSRTGTNRTSDSLSELQRVEKERDALMAALEEIVNERSMLAAQVSEMKAMIQSAGGGKAEEAQEEESNVIDLAAELRDAHETMARLTEEMEATLAVLDNRYQETLERAHKAEERCIRLEANGSKLEKEFSKQGIRLSQALTEESRLRTLLSMKENDLEAVKRQSEGDMQKLDESHREELDRSVGKILELTSQVSELQEKMKSQTPNSAERRMNTSSRRLELQIGDLKRLVAESERKLKEERINSKAKLDSEMQKVRVEKEREAQKLSAQIQKLEQNVGSSESTKRELVAKKDEVSRVLLRSRQLEQTVEELQSELKEAKRRQASAEAETQAVRARYEESLKKRISQMDRKAEMQELQVALNSLKEEAGVREKKLQEQLAEFRSRAEQAESAASQAERDAKEAAEAAKLAQERSRTAVEAERKGRESLEAELQVAVRERKEWEKLAHQQRELNSKSEDSSSGLSKSSSRRGLRRSPSKGKDGSKHKRDHGKSSTAGEDSGRKKSSLRPRLFR